MIFAVVPAGGRSTRMGRPKLTLPLGGRTVIEHTVGALAAGGADHVLVVAGPHDPALAAVAAGAGADVLALPAATADMRETVGHGLRRLARWFRPRPADAWLLAPGDLPALSPDAVRLVCEAGRRHPDSITIPVCGERRGHPVLLPWRLAAAVEALPAGQGIDALVRSHGAATVEVPAGGVLEDLDTPADYHRLGHTWPPSVPGPEIPVFGPADPAAVYVPRPGGYAVIFGPTGDLAVVATPAGQALPGGGQNPGEGPAEATAREVGEECGLRIEVGPCVGVADERVYDNGDRRHYLKRGAFFLAEVVGRSRAGEPDHTLLWLPPAEAGVRLRHGSQRWAVARACRLTGRDSWSDRVPDFRTVS